MKTNRETVIQSAAQTKPALLEANPPLWTASFILIFLSTITIFISFHSMMPTLPIYIQQFGGGTGIAGLALGSLTLAAVLIRPVTGWALDNYGRKRIYIGGLLIFLLVTRDQPLDSRLFFFSRPLYHLFCAYTYCAVAGPAYSIPSCRKANGATSLRHH
jgi:MFS family permease